MLTRNNPRYNTFIIVYSPILSFPRSQHTTNTSPTHHPPPTHTQGRNGDKRVGTGNKPCLWPQHLQVRSKPFCSVCECVIIVSSLHQGFDRICHRICFLPPLFALFCSVTIPARHSVVRFSDGELESGGSGGEGGPWAGGSYYALHGTRGSSLARSSPAVVRSAMRRGGVRRTTRRKPPLHPLGSWRCWVCCDWTETKRKRGCWICMRACDRAFHPIYLGRRAPLPW